MPTEQADLLELAERCEAAEGPDRKLDAIIHNAIGRPLPDQFCGVPVVLDYDELECTFTMPVGSGEHAMRVRYECPSYSASIDAALSLVPEGFLYMVANVYDKKGKPCLGKSTAFICPLDNIAGSEPVNATTPALALTAASLRARATENTDAPFT